MRDRRSLRGAGMRLEAELHAENKAGLRKIFLSCFHLRRRFFIPVYFVLLLSSLCLPSLCQTSHISRSSRQDSQDLAGSDTMPKQAKKIGNSLHNQIGTRRTELHVREGSELDHKAIPLDETNEVKSGTEDTNYSRTRSGAARKSRMRPDTRVAPNASWTPHQRSRRSERTADPASQTSHRHSFLPPKEDSQDPLPSFSLQPRTRGSSQVPIAHSIQPVHVAQKSTGTLKARRSKYKDVVAVSEDVTSHADQNAEEKEEQEQEVVQRLGVRKSSGVQGGGNNQTAGRGVLPPEIIGRVRKGSDKLQGLLRDQRGTPSRSKVVKDFKGTGPNSDDDNGDDSSERREVTGGKKSTGGKQGLKGGRKPGNVERQSPGGKHREAGLERDQVPRGYEDESSGGQVADFKEVGHVETDAEDALAGGSGTGGRIDLHGESELQHMGRATERWGLEPYFLKGRVTGSSVGVEIHDRHNSRRGMGREKKGSVMDVESRIRKAMGIVHLEDFRSLPESLGRRCGCDWNNSLRAVTAGCMQIKAGSSLHAAEETYQSHLERRWQQFPGTFRRPHFPPYSVLRESYMDYFGTVLHPCPGEERMGEWGEGGKWVCRPEELPTSAVIYSIGSNAEASFEHDIYDLTGVLPHAFDHTVAGKLLEDMRSLKFLRFHAIGLGNCSNKVRNVMSMDHIMAGLGHEYVDVLKIDCEGCEIDVFEGIWQQKGFYRVGDKVLFGQVLIEYHNVGKPDIMIRSFAIMEGLGYRMFHIEPNYMCLSCIEVAYIHESLVKPC